MWHQLIDKPEFWPETSGTGDVHLCHGHGRQEWLARCQDLCPAARKAWLGLAEYIDKDANVDEVCVGTGQKQPGILPDPTDRSKGDPHGQAPILWTATERMICGNWQRES